MWFIVCQAFVTLSRNLCKVSFKSPAKIVEVSRVQVIQLLSVLSYIFAYKPHWLVSIW